MSYLGWYEKVNAYCRDYFNSPVTIFSQKKPDEWAREYLKSWFGDEKLWLIDDEALRQACDTVIKEYNKSSWIKRVSLRLSSPISRLKTYHAMLTLKAELNNVGINKTALDSKRLHAAFINARIHREFFFWMYCGLRWFVGASNPWITEGLSSMNEKTEIKNQVSSRSLPPSALCDAQIAIWNVLSKTQFELKEYGTRRGKESLLVGELLKNKSTCADKLGFVSREACWEARNRVTHRETFQTVKNSELSRILFEDKLLYYRALEEEINACQSMLVDNANQMVEPSQVLAALESLLMLIQEGFYLNQYVYSTNDLSAKEPLGRIWDIYNMLPQQLLQYVQTFSKDAPEWLNPWVSHVYALSRHVRFLTNLAKDYDEYHRIYTKLDKKVQKIEEQAIITKWSVITERFLSLEQKRQAAYYSDENNHPFLAEFDQFKSELQSFIDNEFAQFYDVKKNSTFAEESSDSTYMDSAISLYNQLRIPTVLNETFRFIFPIPSPENPFLGRMEKENVAYHRVEATQKALIKTWNETPRYQFSEEDCARLKQELTLLDEQLNELGKQYQMITRLMIDWKPTDETVHLEQQINAFTSLRSTIEQAQGLYQTDVDQSCLVFIDQHPNFLINQDLKTLDLLNETQLTKRKLNQQYKKLSLAYHPDKHISDAMPRCDFLWLNVLTEKQDIVDYYASVCLADAVYIFVEKTGELLYASNASDQIELVASYNERLLAALALHCSANIPLQLKNEQIRLIFQQTNHEHRKRFWDIKINVLKAAYQRLLAGEQNFDVEVWEKSKAELFEKLQRDIQQMREERNTRAVIIEELASNQAHLKTENRQIREELILAEKRSAMETVKAVAEVKQQHTIEIDNLISSNKDLANKVDDLTALVHQLLNKSAPASSEQSASDETKSNTGRSSPGLFG